METELSLKQMQNAWHCSLASYLIGFVGSVLLTIASFSLVAFSLLPQDVLLPAICALAVLQAVVQLIFFLHLGREGKPHWETWIFAFMLLILLIIALGSYWIMTDLNARMMGHHHMANT